MSPSLTLETLEDHMVLVEGGRFEMGSEKWSASKPIHPVSLDNFYLSRYLVSQALWEEVMGNNPAEFSHPSRPIESVSWYDAVDFCNRLSEQLGRSPYYTIDRDRMDPKNKELYDHQKWLVVVNPGTDGYRLPTEAEWEFAAQGGKYGKNLIYAGSDNLKEIAWYEGNSQNISQPNGLKRPNALGLYDMSGNLIEWCYDWHGKDYYKVCVDEDIVENPIGPPEGKFREVRGGSWRIDENLCFHPAFRNFNRAFFSFNGLGFRLSRH